MKNNYLSISELTSVIKLKLEKDEGLQHVLARGEISNFKLHTSGHLYFTLKDAKSKINAVMFMSSATYLKFKPVDGMNVLISGRVGVYEGAGNYQLYVDAMEEDGIGVLYKKYEELKARLNKEGLFDQSLKKEIPKFPRKIGVITARTGAAIKDILSTIKRRFPLCEVIIFPTLVQGEGSSENIARQIEKANEFDLDVIICGRGGGGVEDLWAFNEERVVRAIFNSKIPIISAVGHEVDWTIADFVADLRAPTPTGAAELCVPLASEVLKHIDNLTKRANNTILSLFKNNFNKLTVLKNSYVLKNPLRVYQIKMQKLDTLVESLNHHLTLKIKKYNHSLELLISKLELLNPLNILKKGYAIAKKQDEVITTIHKLKVNDYITIKLIDGEIEAKVEKVG